MNPRRACLAAGVAGGVLYGALVRRWVLTWGASAAEAAAHLPGDELLIEADGVSTRAIGIRAPRSAVWPWIAQMGPAPRGGAYTYDWIENLLGLNMHSADTVLPEFQHPRLGDTIGYGRNRMRLERVEPERVLAWRSQDGNWVWTFVLEEVDGTTRLISRNRFRLPRWMDRIGMVPMEPASLVMERKMLLGIKARAERLATTTAGSHPSGPGPEPSRRFQCATVDGEIIIRRPVEEVFDFVADERNEPRYNPRMLRAEQTSPGPVGVGTRFDTELKTMGRTMPMAVEFTGVDRPRRLASVTRSSMMVTEGELTFEPIAAGTRMRWSWEVRPRGAMRVMVPWVGVIGRRQEQDIWGALKRLLESDGDGA
ncbi:MAG TPA: SRPBCC family protein [Solirubrobacteraceae bacterium]|nr:SRPBCC family protein [Solirubrobacteraceae bacterium]